MQKGSARPIRAQGICKAIPNRSVSNWVGDVSELSSNGEGKGVLTIKIGDEIYVSTWNNALSDTFDRTLIDPSSAIFQAAINLKIGQKVVFSGEFVKSETDCIQEPSLTLYGSISSPKFIIKFTDVRQSQ